MTADTQGRTPLRARRGNRGGHGMSEPKITAADARAATEAIEWFDTWIDKTAIRGMLRASEIVMLTSAIRLLRLAYEGVEKEKA